MHASAATLRLVTFDADGTLYADGAHMEQDNRMIGHIVDLMRARVHVAIVTAAGCASRRSWDVTGCRRTSATVVLHHSGCPSTSVRPDMCVKAALPPLSRLSASLQRIGTCNNPGGRS